MGNYFISAICKINICEIANGISYPAVNDKDILGSMAPDLDDQYQKQYADILEQSDKSKFELQYVKRNVKEMIKCSQKKIQLNR